MTDENTTPAGNGTWRQRVEEAIDAAAAATEDLRNRLGAGLEDIEDELGEAIEHITERIDEIRTAWASRDSQ